MTEWQLYAQKIEGDAWQGEKIDPAKIEKMSGEFFASYMSFLACGSNAEGRFLDQQMGQLYELMQAIRKHASEEGEGEA